MGSSLDVKPISDGVFVGLKGIKLEILGGKVNAQRKNTGM